ncbi:helix-turn-helix domain-containing protein [Porphyromonas gingivalis]|uniref:helix-turn-helix domain-containing protein n=1 Tax=Porphyromonas gingivalis TaxID=837 RepID=UPI001F19855D|nr:helix-turn-helix transcriptional regulator [Porphyromonas gingivalis]MCE8164936.1 helix-turn-helix transcriptional regulator [Porphyromonas gingivalis]
MPRTPLPSTSLFFKGLSKWLAEQLGKSENTISKWCSNKVQPSLENLVEIAKILDVDVRELIVSTKESR